MIDAIHESTTPSYEAQLQQPAFEVGDIVEIDDELGGNYTIVALYRDFAWVLSDIEGFDTVELLSLKRQNPGHVEITSGVVQMAYSIGEYGMRLQLDEIGQHRFFVDAVESNGCRIGMWEGATHHEAIVAAQELGADGFGVIHDMVLGCAA